jgi:uncharacterized protein YqgC (DUF456 family)
VDTLWIVIGGLIMLVGLAGCVLPLLPGPTLCFIALWMQQLRDDKPFTSEFIWIWAGVTVLVTMLEFVIPVYGTKRYGGTKYGMWGCTLGLIFGFWLGPLGIIIGPFVGAFIAELIANADSKNAMRAALGSFVGFLVGTLLKVISCFVMIYYFILTLW